jgi:hypothetical protein
VESSSKGYGGVELYPPSLSGGRLGEDQNQVCIVRKLREQYMDLIQAEQLLDQGKLEMITPWGAWVPISRRANIKKQAGVAYSIPVYMENEVEAYITTKSLHEVRVRS